MDDPRVLFKLPPPGLNAGKALAFCREVLQQILVQQSPVVYKIGITGNPMFRFYKKPTSISPSAGYYYERDQFQFMYILYATETWDESALMEAVLIEAHLSKPGCRNIRPGGEGRQVYTGPFFCYVVCKSLKRPPKQ